MYCTNCNHLDSKVIDSRTIQTGNCIRRRECLNCSFRFTYEYIANTPIKLLKNGSREEFDRQKLQNSFNVACNKDRYQKK